MAETPVPLETHYDLTQIGSVALSPDGSRVAFVAREADPDEEENVASLFVAPTDGSRDPHRLTRVNGASSPTWGPDGDRLAFLATRDTDTGRRVGRDDSGGVDAESDTDATDDADNIDGNANDTDGDTEDTDDADNTDDADDGPGGSDDPTPQVWVFDLALGGDARQVTTFEEGAQEFDWGPDGDRLVVAARDPTEEERAYLDSREDGGPVETERLQHKLDGVGYLDTVDTYLHVVPVDDAGDGVERLDDAYGADGAFGELSGLQPVWGAGGRIAFLSCRTDHPDDTMVRDVYTISPDGSGLRRETEGDLTASAPEWGPDGKRLSFHGTDPENWCLPSQVYVTGEDGPRSLTADLDRTAGGRYHWLDESTLVGLIGDEGQTRLVRVGLDGTVERVFDAQGDDRGISTFDAGDERFVAVLSHPTDGEDLFAFDTADLDATTEPDSFTRLTAVNESFVADHPTPEVEWVSWDTDGVEVEGLVYSDPDTDLDAGNHPVVVAIHGGPISYDEPTFSHQHTVLTSRGYVVFRPNYRGGSSYGREFAEALRGQWGTHEVTDIVDGVDHLAEKGWIDPDRVFGYGFSYGGIAQGYLVTQTDLLTAAAPEHGIYDLRSSFGTDDSHVWAENEYGLPWEESEAYDAASAITDAGEIDTPLLIAAGGRDWRCPPSQSEQLYVAARKQDVPARLVVYEDEHHNIGEPERAIHRMEEVLAWYERFDPAVDADSADDPHGRREEPGETE